MPLLPKTTVRASGHAIKRDPNPPALPKQETAEYIVISDDEDDAVPNCHPLQNRADLANRAATPAPPARRAADDDDSDDDEVQFVSAAGPASATLNSQPRKIPAAGASAAAVATRATASNSVQLGKRRAPGNEDGQEQEHGWQKRVKDAKVSNGLGVVATTSTGNSDGGGAAAGAVGAAGAAVASIAGAGGVKAEAPPQEVQQPLHTQAGSTTSSSTRRVTEWTAANPAVNDAVWRPPTPPHSTSPPRSDDNTTLERFECNLEDHTPRAPGAREYPVKDIWPPSGFDFANVPFEIKEVPSFERGSWLGLCTHRYLVVSSRYPRTPEEKKERAGDIKRQLLKLFRIAAWERGEEVEVSFPVVSRTDKDFVDVKFFNASQHALARVPGSQLRFEGEYEPFKPFVHGAFVDPTQWLILQFTHPRILLHPNEALTEAQKADLRHFAKTALIALARHRHLGALATPTALWSLPEGFPHNTELAQTNNFTRAPEYVLLLKRRPNTERLQPPSHVKLDHIAAAGVRGFQGWLKLWWDGREPDLCNYCKSATDGHTNAGCRYATRRADGANRAVKYRPAVY